MGSGQTNKNFKNIDWVGGWVGQWVNQDNSILFEDL